MQRKINFFDDPDTIWIRVVILWLSATFGSPIVVVATGWPKWIGAALSIFFGIGIPAVAFYAWRMKRKEQDFLK